MTTTPHPAPILAALAVIAGLALLVWLTGGPAPCASGTVSITVGSMPVGEHCAPAPSHGAPEDGQPAAGNSAEPAASDLLPAAAEQSEATP